MDLFCFEEIVSGNGILRNIAHLMNRGMLHAGEQCILINLYIILGGRIN